MRPCQRQGYSYGQHTPLPSDEWAFSKEAKTLVRRLIVEFLDSAEADGITDALDNEPDNSGPRQYLGTLVQTALTLAVLSEFIQQVKIPHLVDDCGMTAFKSTVSFPRLHTFVVEFCTGEAYRSPNIARFVMKHSPSPQTLRLFAGSKSSQTLQPNLPDLPQVLSLTIFDCGDFRVNDTLDIKDIINSCRNIARFKVWDNTSSSIYSRYATENRREESSKAFWTVKSLESASSTLETVMLGRCPRVTEYRDMQEFTSFGDFPHLKVIGIWAGNIMWHRESPLVELVRDCTELSTLIVSEAKIGAYHEDGPHHFKHALVDLAKAAMHQMFPRLRKVQICLDSDGAVGPEAFRFFAGLFRSANVVFSVLREDKIEELGSQAYDNLGYSREVGFSLE